MNNIYVEALYNESRNATPSWQGYHYQGQAATLFFLRYILDRFNSHCEHIDEISMKIEWMEDFIIFEKNIIRQICQVKKTLNNSDYTDVMKNFILQHKIIDDDLCKWVVVYDESDNTAYESITQNTFDVLYNSYIRDCILHETSKLVDNHDKPQFWTDNLNLKFSESELPNIRNYIRKLMDNERLSRRELTQQKCDEFIGEYINTLRSKLVRRDNDFARFQSQVLFSNLKIDTLESESINIVKQLISNRYISKSDIISESEIVSWLYILIYQKLMNVKDKKTDMLTITFSDVREIFVCTEKSIFLWKGLVYQTREEMVKNIKVCCDECSIKECTDCAVTKFLNLDFSEVTDNCNLEYPKFHPENITDSLKNKLSAEKYNHLIDILFSYKDKINCFQDDSYVELQQGTQRMFVSEYISDDRFSKEKLIENIPQHFDVYREYNSIVTKCFNEVIDYKNIKIIKDLEETEKEQPGEKEHPKFIDTPLINFISKTHLKGD